MNAPPPSTPPSPYQQLDALRDEIESDYVSIVELTIWLLVVLSVLTGMHFFFRWMRAEHRNEAVVSKPVAKAEVTVWAGKLGDGAYAIAQQPADASEVAQFMDEHMADAFGQPVRSYWLTLFVFDGLPAGVPADWSQARIVAVVGGKPLEALQPREGVAPAVRFQLSALTAPITLQAGHETRSQLFFPAHELSQLERIELTLPGAEPLVLRPVKRSLQALQDFRTRPGREFFVSVFSDEAGAASTSAAPSSAPASSPAGDE